MTRKIAKRIVWLAVFAAVIVLAVLGLREGLHRLDLVRYPLKYTDYVEAAATENGVDPLLIYAVIRTESEFEPEVVSRANAKGLMQMKDTTFTDLQRRAGEPEPLPPESLFDPETSIRYGVYYMRLLLDQFEDTDTMLAAYNAGPGAGG